MRRLPPVAGSLAALVVLLASGCRESKEPRVYRAPKDTPSPLARGGSAHDHDHDDDHPPTGPTWVLPAGWKRLANQEMRHATFQVDPADPKLVVVISTFGPESGPVLPNVNRWEQQIGAPVSTEADLEKVVTRVESNGLTIESVDIRGPAPAGAEEGVRMLAAIIPVPGQVWFFKFVGAESKIAAHKPAYDAFLRSFSLGGVGAHPKDRSGDTIPGVRAWTLPEGWTVDPAPREMRVATILVRGEGQEAEVIVTSLPGEQSGTLEANVNRWRAQIGLDAVPGIATLRRRAVAVGDVEGTVLEFGGADEPAPSGKAIVLVQASRGGSVWYFKLMGPAPLVAAHREALVNFVGSIEFGD